jgi:ethanolamine kinase
VNEVDYCRYPVRETQLQWLRYYLQAQKGMAVTPREVERLYVQVNKFALVSACNRGREKRPFQLPTHSPVLG